MYSIDWRQIESARDAFEILFREGRPALHQRFVNFPELPGRLGGVLRELGGAYRILAARHRQVSIHIPHSVPEPASELFDDVVNRVAAGARVATVFNESHLGVRRTQNLVTTQVDRRIEYARHLVSVVTGASRQPCFFLQTKQTPFQPMQVTLVTQNFTAARQGRRSRRSLGQ